MLKNPIFIAPEVDEIIDIVDQNDCVIDSIERERAFQEDIGYRRVALAFLKNKKGELCFLKRSETVSYLANHFAIVGGCVQSGETYEDAIKREVAEEVNVTVVACRQLAVLKPEETDSQLFKAVFEIEVDIESINFCPTAFSSYVWLKPEDYHQKVKECQLDPVLPDLCYMVRRFYTNM